MPFFAASEAPPSPESANFPVFSLLAGNLAFSETSSQLTPPSTGESRANLTSSIRRQSRSVVSLAGDRGFESFSLHQRVDCEPDFLLFMVIPPMGGSLVKKPRKKA